MSKKIVMASGVVVDAPLKLKTVYMFKDRGRIEIVKVNRGSNLFEAGLNVQRNLQINKYQATYAEVLDADTDQLYYSQSRSIATGKLSAPHYEWNPADTVTKFGVSVLFAKD